jgi:hypothetical protein
MIVRVSLEFVPLAPTASETGSLGSTSADPASLATFRRKNSGPNSLI